jgi:hypothetical protein
MTVSQDLREIQHKIHDQELPLSDGMSQVSELLQELDAERHRDRIHWLTKERDGYEEGEYPLAYAPSARKPGGELYQPGEFVSPLISQYRMQLVLLCKKGLLGNQTQKQHIPMLMGVGEIERWARELPDQETAAVVGNQNGWTINTFQFDFAQTWQKIKSRLLSLIDDVIEELPEDPNVITYRYR